MYRVQKTFLPSSTLNYYYQCLVVSVGADLVKTTHTVTVVCCCLLLFRELVRKKAVMVMHKFYSLSPGTVDHLEDDFRRCLSDKDPGVMEAALVLFHDMIVVSWW